MRGWDESVCCVGKFPEVESYRQTARKRVVFWLTEV